MRVLLTLVVLLLGVAVCIEPHGLPATAAGATLAAGALLELRWAWQVRRARRVLLPRAVVVDDLAPHLRALRDSARGDLTRADALSDRLTPPECQAVVRAGLQTDLALRAVIDARLELAALVETAEQRPEPKRRARAAPPPRVVCIEHTASTVGGAS